VNAECFATTPSNATITSATLSLWTANDVSDNDRTIRVYRLKVPFNEMEATWNESASGVSWQSAGAAGANEASGTEKQIALKTNSLQAAAHL
jgi:hypothetical protein